MIVCGISRTRYWRFSLAKMEQIRFHITSRLVAVCGMQITRVADENAQLTATCRVEEESNFELGGRSLAATAAAAHCAAVARSNAAATAAAAAFMMHLVAACRFGVLMRWMKEVIDEIALKYVCSTVEQKAAAAALAAFSHARSLRAIRVNTERNAAARIAAVLQPNRRLCERETNFDRARRRRLL